MKTTTTLSVVCSCLLVACAGQNEDRPFGESPGLPPSADDGDDDGFDDDDDGDDDGDPEPDPEPEPEPSDNRDALDAHILSLGHLDIEPIASKHEVACPGVCSSWQDGDLMCTETYFGETDHIDTFIAMQPNSPALWPGAVLRGDEMEQGFLSPVGLSRVPTTFSLSLENLNAAPSAVMEEPSLSAFRDLRNEILADGVDGSTPAQLSYDINVVYSASQLSVMVGAQLGWDGVIDLDAMFDFDDQTLRNKYLFDFTQTYYTADLDTPSRPSGLFDPATAVEDLAPYMGEGNPPVYVQSVSYGRRVLFGIESNESLEVIVAAVDAAIAEIAGVQVGVQDSEALTGAKITATVLGGDGEGAVATVLGIEQLLQFITDGGNYTSKSPGAPIAYKLAYLDNAPARLALTSEYPEAICQ